MARFRKKPAVIDAVRWEPHPAFARWTKRGYENVKVGRWPDGVDYTVTECGITNAYGFQRIKKGDYLCTQIVTRPCADSDEGLIDRWAVNPDIFAATYEPAD